MTSKAFDAATILGLELSTLDAATVSAAYRAKAKDCHPDHHGADQLHQWAQVSWAKECLTQWLAKQPSVKPADVALGDCKACEGSGRINIGKGFKPLNIMCVMCNGSGGGE